MQFNLDPFGTSCFSTLKECKSQRGVNKKKRVLILYFQNFRPAFVNNRTSSRSWLAATFRRAISLVKEPRHILSPIERSPESSHSSKTKSRSTISLLHIRATLNPNRRMPRHVGSVRKDSSEKEGRRRANRTRWKKPIRASIERRRPTRTQSDTVLTRFRPGGIAERKDGSGAEETKWPNEIPRGYILRGGPLRVNSPYEGGGNKEKKKTRSVSSREFPRSATEPPLLVSPICHRDERRTSLPRPL